MSNVIAKGNRCLLEPLAWRNQEELSTVLHKNGVAHEVLNAKHHQREAAIIARAGAVGAVTVATYMAGLGTDIMLGGNPEFMADFELQRRGLTPVETPGEYESAWPEELVKQRGRCRQGTRRGRRTRPFYMCSAPNAP